MKTFSRTSILLADDDDGHAELIKDALVESGVENPIERFSNGKAVWDFLEQSFSKAEDQNAGFLLLLDINMPVMDGVEVLKKIRSHEKMSSLPVFILTTTDDPQEIHSFYHMGCNICISKPIDYAQFTDTIRQLGRFIKVIKL
jgi:CheY-like chemotaxis protein